MSNPQVGIRVSWIFNWKNYRSVHPSIRTLKPWELHLIAVYPESVFLGLSEMAGNLVGYHHIVCPVPYYRYLALGMFRKSIKSLASGEIDLGGFFRTLTAVRRGWWVEAMSSLGLVALVADHAPAEISGTWAKRLAIKLGDHTPYPTWFWDHSDKRFDHNWSWESYSFPPYK